MKRTLLLLLFCLISNYIFAQVVVKLKLPDNCKSAVTGINDKVEADGSKIEITPNPSSGIFILTLSFNSRIGNATLNVYNIQGESVFNENIYINSDKLVKEINLSGLQPGIYIFNFKNAKVVNSTKLLIHK